MNSSAIVAALACLASAAPAMAQTTAAPSDRSAFGIISSSQTVPASDLQLTTPRGRRALQARLDQAVRDVCGRPSRVLQREARRHGCTRDALDQIQAQTRSEVYRVDVAAPAVAH